METTTNTTPTRKGAGGRPAKGSLVWQGDGWAARFWTTIDGERMRVTCPLGTNLKPIAARKLAHLVAEASAGAPSADATRSAESVDEAASRILTSRQVSDEDNDRIRYRLHIAPHIGPLSVAAVRSAHVRGVLDAIAAAGKSHATIVHVRRVMALIFDSLWRDEMIAENPVDRVKAPKGCVEKRERAVLTDSELARYLAWEHPNAQFRPGVLQRQTMACISRMFGGVCTGDLHALDWQALDIEEGGFSFGWAPRKKTARPQLLEVPEMLRPILRDWWKRQGKPKAGLVFPALTGKEAGVGPKTGVSHAEALRRDLLRAFGVEVWSGRQLGHGPRNDSSRG